MPVGRLASVFEGRSAFQTPPVGHLVKDIVIGDAAESVVDPEAEVQQEAADLFLGLIGALAQKDRGNRTSAERVGAARPTVHLRRRRP